MLRASKHRDKRSLAATVVPGVHSLSARTEPGTRGTFARITFGHLPHVAWSRCPASLAGSIRVLDAYRLLRLCGNDRWRNEQKTAFSSLVLWEYDSTY